MHSEYILEQLQHQPTREMFETIHALALQSNYHHALEIGIAWGISTIAILTAGTGDLLSVDSGIYSNTTEQVNHYNFANRWRFINETSQKYMPTDRGMYDFICIDGSHYYHDVLQDIENCLPRLKKSGIMVIDDYLHRYNFEKDYGVKQAVDEMVEKYNLILTVHNKANGIAEIRYGE